MAVKVEKVTEFYKTDDVFMQGLREGYPLDEDTAFQTLRFLTIFSIGCMRLKVEPNRFDERLNLFIMDLYRMGYRGPKIRQMVGSVCNYIKVD